MDELQDSFNGNIPNVSCEKSTSREPGIYSSFKITLTTKFLDDILNPDFWPERVAMQIVFYEATPAPHRFVKNSKSTYAQQLTIEAGAHIKLKAVKILHLNTQSILLKEEKPHLFCVTEHFLKHEELSDLVFQITY